MKCITLPQPWATLVMIGAKTLETRRYLPFYAGALGIHASESFSPDQKVLLLKEPYRSVLKAGGYRRNTPLPLGAIVGTVELMGVIPTDQIWCQDGLLRNAYTAHAFVICKQEWAFGDYSPGRFAWKLANPQLCAEPIPHKDSPGLWDWDGASWR